METPRNNNNNNNNITITPLFFFVFSLLFLISTFSTPTMAKIPSNATIYIVYVVSPASEEPAAFHVKLLAAVLGSEEAAKEAMVYNYIHVANAFAAWLTPDQLSEILKQPGVLQAIPNDKIHVPGRLRLLHHKRNP